MKGDKLKSYISLIVLGVSYSLNVLASTTHIQHIIKNETPFEFYYVVSPTTEVPTAFSCNCAGMLAPGEQHICDCYSQLKVEERRYRMEYMRNISPTFKLSATHSAYSNVAILWTLSHDSHWDWLSVKAKSKPLD